MPREFRLACGALVLGLTDWPDHASLIPAAWLRKHLRWTQTQLAEVLEISPRQLRYYEHKDGVPHLSKPMPRQSRLACAALALGLMDYPDI